MMRKEYKETNSWIFIVSLIYENSYVCLRGKILAHGKGYSSSYEKK
jgi:hypothetical protein